MLQPVQPAAGACGFRTTCGLQVGKPLPLKPVLARNWFSRSPVRTATAAVEAPSSPSATAQALQDATPAGSSSSSAAAAVPSVAAVAETVEEKFNWYKAWYPIAALESLQTDTPNAVQLLGMRLVLWQDKAGSWRCFEDLCPHRLAPLSEGRIHESGQLQCTYHGWLFNEKGGCSSIPQIGDPKAHSTACSSNRACVAAFPTQVLHGMLWVFADSSPEGWREAMAADGTPVRPAAASSELLEQGWELKAPWFQRDVPLSFDVLLENMTDPAHVPQSHHGVVVRSAYTLWRQGERPAHEHPDDHPCGKGGLRQPGVTRSRHGLVCGDIHGTQPGQVSVPRPNDAAVQRSIAKGWSRVVMSFVGPPGSKQTRPATPQLPPALNWFIDNVVERFPALQHALNRNAIIDGDTYFMHAAERTLYERGDHASWSKQYYLPAAADAAVVSWRRWIDRFGSQLPVLPRGAHDLPPLMSREQVFDRYSQHTKHCPHCRAALRNTEIAIGLLAIAGAVAAGTLVVAAANAAAAAAGAGTVAAGAAGLPVGAAAKLTAAAAAVAVLAGAAVAALLRFRQLFIYNDYVHAEH
ncbi:pheophorbide a oxygenase [Scenedesmus sp. NREL 46B-D3]|nr:pheophorbide a oxygenase [Scenedesmus sp. NREL 46B-D3]